MSGSGGTGVVGAIAVTGVMYFMAAAAVAALAGAVVAGVVILGVLILAVIAWIKLMRIKLMRQALRIGDRGWARDLLLAPGVGIAGAALLAGWFPINDFLDDTVNASDAPLWLQLAPAPVGILFFALLISLPWTLRRDGPRWLAYPGFVFYAVYLTALDFQAPTPAPAASRTATARSPVTGRGRSCNQGWRRTRWT